MTKLSCLMAFVFCSSTSNNPILSSCCFGDQVENVQEWERRVHRVLSSSRTPTVLGLSEHTRRGLLLDDNLTPAASAALDIDDFDLEQLSFQGLPSRPFYKVLALRLCLLSLQEKRFKENNIQVETNADGVTSYQFPLQPARMFGFQEDEPPALLLVYPPPRRPTVQEIVPWIQRARDRGVLALLGLRHTVGTDPGRLLPPSRSDLLVAATVRHKPHAPLTVAARARAKHAHRGTTDQFFGTVRGSPETQNAAAQEILLQLLENAAWINIHTFGGMEGRPSLEVRVPSGYGARWTADWSQDPARPTSIEFRGFLEPQMEYGHEKGWRH